MKIHITAILTAAVMLTAILPSCTSDADGIYGSFPYLHIDDKYGQISVSNKDTVLTIPVETNRSNLIATSDTQWVTVIFNKNKLHLTVHENDTEISRTCLVSVRDQNNKCNATIVIKQDDNGIRTYHRENTILESDEDIRELASTYSRISRNLILGDARNHEFSGTSIVDSYSTRIGGEDLTFNASDGITDLSPIKDAITEIPGGLYIILNSKLSDISPLLDFDVNNWTLVCNNSITSIRQLQETGVIDTLTIQHSPMIQDFNVIGQMSELKYLDLSNNELSDISFLKDLSLQTLILGSTTNESNSIGDISVLYGMSTLRFLDISGLPVPQSQIDELSRLNPNCEITADNMQNNLPELGNVLFSSNASSINLVCEIFNTSTTAEVARKGFYFGPDPDNLTFYEDETDDESTITLTISDLDSSSYYYTYALIETEKGLGSVYTATGQVYTLGRAVFDSNPIGTDAGETEITVTGTMMHPGNPAVVEFGTILGKDSNLDLEHYDAIMTNTFNSIYADMPHTWSDTFSGLEKGTVYYVRTYADVEGMGRTYSEIQTVTTTGTPDMPNTVTLTVEIPSWSDPADAEVTVPEQFFGYYFRNDIIGSGEPLEGLKESNGRFLFYLPSGTQDMIFSNTAGQATSGGNGLQWSMQGSAGMQSDLLVYTTRDLNVSGNMQITATPERVTSLISRMLFVFYDENGDRYEDLSSRISEVRITASGVSTTYTIDQDMNGTYSGNGTIALGTDIIPTDDEITIAENIHLLPPSGNKSFALTVSITFTDGTVMTRPCSFRSLRPNCIYDLTVNLYNFSSESGNSFTVDVIETIEEEIEF